MCIVAGVSYLPVYEERKTGLSLAKRSGASRHLIGTPITQKVDISVRFAP